MEGKENNEVNTFPSNPLNPKRANKKLDIRDAFSTESNIRGTKLQSECYICKRQYKAFKYLKNHFRKMHLPNEKFQTRPLVCQLCNKQIMSKYGLIRHLREIHLKLYEYFCVDCGHQSLRSLSKEHCKECEKYNSNIQYCYDCCASFKSVNDYIFHRKNSHQWKFSAECHKCKYEGPLSKESTFFRKKSDEVDPLGK